MAYNNKNSTYNNKKTFIRNFFACQNKLDSLQKHLFLVIFGAINLSKFLYIEKQSFFAAIISKAQKFTFF
jgi:hypothetical protein